jgi:hypothetical protein
MDDYDVELESLLSMPEEDEQWPVEQAGTPSQRAFQFFIDQGYRPLEAAAIVGHLVHESGLDPTKTHDGGIGLGIAGWNGQRLEALRKFAGARGTDANDFGTQLAFVDHELKGPEGKALTELRGANDITAATRAFMHYERPQGYTQWAPEQGHGFLNRLKQAQLLLGGAQAQAQVQPQSQAQSQMPVFFEGIPDGVELPPQPQQGPSALADPFEQFAVGAGTLAMSTPWAMGASVAAIPDWLRGAQEPNAVTSYLLDRAARGRRHAETLPTMIRNWNFGEQPAVENKPRTVGGHIARALGESLTPAGAYTLPLTAGMTGAHLLSSALTGPDGQVTDPFALSAIAQTPRTLPGPNPGLVEPGNIPFANGVDTQVVKLKDGRYVVLPRFNTKGREMPAVEARKYFTRRGKSYGIFTDEASANEYANRLLTYTAPRRDISVVQTANGPQKVDGSTLSTLGMVGAATLGFAFAPSIARRLLAGVPVKAVPVPDAKPGTMDISRRVDLIRTYDDVNAGILQLTKRAGATPAELSELSTIFKVQTRGQSGALAQNAITFGSFEIPSYSFKVQTPLSKLHQLDVSPKVAVNPQQQAGILSPSIVSEYMNARSTFAEIMQMQGKGQAGQTGPLKLRGWDERTLLQHVQDMERAYPYLKDVEKVVKQNRAATLRFMRSGEYGTMTSKEYKKQMQEGLDFIPFDGAAPPVGNSQWQLNRYRTADLGTWMQQEMTRRMENEAIGRTIDLLRRHRPELAVRMREVDAKGKVVKSDREVLNENPNWEDKTISFYRRGKKETYSVAPFIADTLKMDPYYFTSTYGQTVNALKNIYEASLTRDLAPWFAPVSMLRNWQAAKVTAAPGMKAPSLLGTFAAIPRQLYPQMALGASKSIEDGIIGRVASSINDILNTASGGALKDVLGPQVMHSLSRNLAATYDASLLARINTVGSHRGSWMEKMYAEQLGLLDEYAKKMPEGLRTFTQSWRALLNSIHNAPEFAYVAKNVNKKPLYELAMEARNLAGNPRVRGQYATKWVDKERTGPIRGPVGYERSNVLDRPIDLYGRFTEIGRVSIPWFNPTQQGIKRMAKAWVDDPINFTTKVYAWSVAPAAMAWSYTAALGDDPRGHSYLDYARNRRSEYNKLMFWYFPIPGLPAERGLEIPRLHELSIASALTETVLDHAFGHNLRGRGEDMRRLMGEYAGVTIDPPIPTPGPQLFGIAGQRAPMSLFGSEKPWSPRSTELDATKGLDSSVHNLIAGFTPGIAQMVGAFADAYVSDEGSTASKIMSGFSEAGKRAVSKAPIVRDVFGIERPATSQTQVMKEYQERRRAIDDLVRRFDTSDAVSRKSITQGGGVEAEALMGKEPPLTLPGLPNVAPTNPLYNRFIEEVRTKFGADNPDKGALGFRSMLQRIAHDTRFVQSLAKVNAGNLATWHKRIEEKPELKAYAEANNVDWRNVDAMRNLYEWRRQSDLRVLLAVIKKVEAEFSQALGRPMTMMDLKPYANEDE